jgi:hypothetical protein
MKRSAYPNTQSAAHALRDWINEGHYLATRLSAQPYNRFEPLYTYWWLVPSTDWPAYHHSKFFFHALDARCVLYTGIYVEKGLSPVVAAAYPTGRKFIMNRDWAWHRVLAALRAGEMTEAVVAVAQRTGLPVCVEVDAGYVEDPGSYDPQALPMDWNWAVFDTQDGALELTDSGLSRGNLFAALVKSPDLPTLAKAMAEIPGADWTWVNFKMGTRLEMAPLVPDAESLPADAWDAPVIWEKCLQPWKPWIF